MKQAAGNGTVIENLEKQNKLIMGTPNRLRDIAFNTMANIVVLCVRLSNVILNHPTTGPFGFLFSYFSYNALDQGILPSCYFQPQNT